MVLLEDWNITRRKFELRVSLPPNFKHANLFSVTKSSTSKEIHAHTRKTNIFGLVSYITLKL